MATPTVKVLLLEDSQPDAELLKQFLELAELGHFEVVHIEVLAEALERLRTGSFDVVLLDLSLPDSTGIETLLKMRRQAPGQPIVVLTGFNDERLGRDAIRQGAQDYLIKGQVDGRQIARGIRHAIERAKSEQALRESEERYRQLASELERKVESRTADLRLLNQTLRERAMQLRALASQLTRAEQQERRRIAQVMHDHFQQLLVGAKFNIGVLRRKIKGKGVEESLEHLTETLNEAIKTARSLTAELSPPVLHEKGLVSGLEWLCRQMDVKYGLDVKLTADPAADVSSEQLRQFLFEAVRELLFNVVKHAGVMAAEIRLERAGDEIRLMVADAGVGCDPKLLETKIGSGVGFGLFTIRERLNLMGGHLEIEGALSRGSRFLLVAPSSQEEAVGVMTNAQGGSRTGTGSDTSRVGKIRVLLADDHTLVRRELSLLLQEEDDMEVVGEADGSREAIELTRRLLPDALVMDACMPDMKGFETIRTLVTEFPRLRVIGLSMYEAADMAGAMLEAGASAYVMKGSPTEELIAAIRGR